MLNIRKVLENFSLCCSRKILLSNRLQSGNMLKCNAVRLLHDSDSDSDPNLDVFTSIKHTEKTSGVMPGKGPPPDVPVYCCMSGCQNCVWLEYAEELVKYYANGSSKAIQSVHDNVEDPNLKSFILLELKMRGIS